MPLLATVGGNADLVLPFNANFALGSLRTVAGNLTLPATTSFTTVRPSIMPLLASGGGDLLLRQVGFPCSTDLRWPSLEQVGGTLTIDQTRPLDQPFGATGATHLSLAGLHMDATTSEQIPLRADVVVRGAGAVTFTNNASLRPCQIQAFAAGLTSRGWTGAAVESGNGTAVTCAPCPAAASCP